MVVSDLLGLLLGDASHNGSLSRVRRMVLHDHTFSEEVKLYFFTGLTVIQTDLDSTAARANALDVILLNCGFKDVLAAGDLLESFSIGV